MILSTCETVPGREIASVLGLVKGNSVRGRHVGINLMAGLKGAVGGEKSQPGKQRQAAYLNNRYHAIERQGGLHIQSSKAEAADIVAKQNEDQDRGQHERDRRQTCRADPHGQHPSGRRQTGGCQD